jgi:hypothetical protein
MGLAEVSCWRLRGKGGNESEVDYGHPSNERNVLLDWTFDAKDSPAPKGQATIGRLIAAGKTGKVNAISRLTWTIKA